MRRYVLAVTALMAAATAAAVAAAVAPSALAGAPDSYDGKTVTAAGTVKNFQTSSTIMGTVAGFQLCDTACVVVVDQQNHPQTNGKTATVTGVFHKTFKGPRKTFTNAIVIAK